MLRRHHYERAFEEYLRSRRIPYVAVDEARKTLLPGDGAPSEGAIKSFDFVVYGGSGNLLVDIKGRRVQASRRRPGELTPGRLDSWVTKDDLASLEHWEGLFGPGFEAVFVFIYWCAAQPPDALFQEVFAHRGEWYALRCVKRSEYARCMKPRSPKWRTVYVPRAAFERISQPFAPAAGSGLGADLFGPGPGLVDLGPMEPALEPLTARGAA